MRIKKSQLFKLIKEFKKELDVNNYDFSDNLSDGGDGFNLPPESPERGGGGERNYPQEVINQLRLISELGIGPFVPDPNAQDYWNEGIRRQVAIDLAGPGEPRRSKILVVRALDSIESEDKAPTPPKIELQFGFRVFYGSDFPDFITAEQKKINCFSERHVNDIVSKILQFSRNIKLKPESELEQELLDNFKNRNFLQKYGRL
jgi:hypothetical protein